MEYGYIRVSTKDQNEARQVNAMHNAGLDDNHLVVEKQSGKDFNRPKYKKLIRTLKEGDVLFIKSIDRLGRDYDEILEQWTMLRRKKKVDIVVLDMPLLDTRTGDGNLMSRFIADLILLILSYVSETERRFTLQRQKEGIAAAKANGVKLGRKPTERPRNYDEVADLYRDSKVSLRSGREMLGISHSTFQKWLKNDKEKEDMQSGEVRENA